MTAPVCPDGHESSTEDYCDVCGTPMVGSSSVPSNPVPASPAGPVGSPPPADSARPGAVAGSGSVRETAETCAQCGAPRLERFCEECGHDSALPATAELSPSSTGPAATGWIAVATADRDWFDEVRRREGPDAPAMTFPEFCPRRSFPLDGDQVTIGRRSRSRGVEPDIDLTGPPVDPGISAQHAMFLVDELGAWRIVDLDSTNGTVLAGPSGDRPLHPHTPVTLTESDTVKLGAWTTLRLRRR